jgi:CheY-like chemotaxis protein
MEAIGQLAGGVAHDFNNLLLVIQGYADLAYEKSEPNSIISKSLEQILQASERSATLIRQLLAFSRRQVLDLTPIDLNKIVQDILKMMKRLLGEHVSIDFKQKEFLFNIEADQAQLEQVIINLCLNARDAMPMGGIITISTNNISLDKSFCERHTWGKPGEYVQLTISDTGCGIEADKLNSIFEPFYTTKEVGQGSGLGLATVYGIVKQHNGYIEVKSVVNEGTEFKIYFPITEQPTAKSKTLSTDNSLKGTETILIAEDEQIVRELIESILTTNGYTVITAENGAEAIKKFDSNLPEVDMVILDVMMPKMSGKEVLDTLHKKKPDLPALFASGYSMNQIHTNFVLDDGTELLQKPFLPKELLEKVRKVIDKK